MPAPTNTATATALPTSPKIVPIPPAKPFQSTLRYPSNRKTIYDRHLNRTRTSDASLASFAYLFNALINYHHARSPSVSELENRLNRAGYPIGLKLLDLLLYRSTPSGSASGRGGSGSTSSSSSSSSLGSAQRPTRLLDLLQFIHNTLWRAMFNRSADALEQSTTKKNEYMIIDNEPVVNTHISIPKEMSQLNCAAFVAGVVEGVCDAAGFPTDGVTAHWGAAEGEEMWPGKTIFLLRFKELVVEREDALKAGGG